MRRKMKQSDDGAETVTRTVEREFSINEFRTPLSGLDAFAVFSQKPGVGVDIGQEISHRHSKGSSIGH